MMEHLKSVVGIMLEILIYSIANKALFISGKVVFAIHLRWSQKDFPVFSVMYNTQNLIQMMSISCESSVQIRCGTNGQNLRILDIKI